MEPRKTGVKIYTDGACKGNPGCGGWASILVCNGVEKVLSGGQTKTTNNRMELLAVINALKALKKPCVVVIESDSEYVVNAVNKNWLTNWQINGTLKSRPNSDLWESLIPLLARHTVKFMWIKGHAGHPYNERCDKEAVRMAGKAQRYSNGNDKNLEISEITFATEAEAYEWQRENRVGFSNVEITEFGVVATIVKDIYTGTNVARAMTSNNINKKESWQSINKAKQATPDFEGQSQFEIRKQKQAEREAKKADMEANKNWVVCALVNGATMFISPAGTTYIESEAKRFTKEAAELKAKALTNNSKSGYMWGINRAG